MLGFYDADERLVPGPGFAAFPEADVHIALIWALVVPSGAWQQAFANGLGDQRQLGRLGAKDTPPERDRIANDPRRIVGPLPIMIAAHG
jgi:hypothetical protein